MRTKLFIVLVLTLGLVTMGAMVSFAVVSSTATISATVLEAESVAMGNLDFGSLSVGYTKGTPDPALTFNSNYASNSLRIWTADEGMVSGEDTIALKYFFSETGASALTDPITETSWGTEWTAVTTTPTPLWSGGTIDKSTAGDATLDFATVIDLTTAPGSYSTVLNLEIIHP